MTLSPSRRVFCTTVSLEAAGLRTRYLVPLPITDLDVRKILQRIVDCLGLEIPAGCRSI